MGRTFVHALRVLERFPATRLVARFDGSLLHHLQMPGDDAVVALGSSIEGASLEEARQVVERPNGRLGGRAPIEGVERVETSFDEPALIGLRIVRPGTSKNDQLDLAQGVAHRMERNEPRPGLPKGIETVVLGPLRGGLVREVALGHAHIVRAEDAFARAGERLRQHRQRRDSTLGPGRPKAQARDQLALVDHPVGGIGERAVAREDVRLAEKASRRSRVLLKDLLHRALGHRAVRFGGRLGDGPNERDERG